MRVILAEKPSVALDIAKALGRPVRHEGYVTVGETAITWAFGHLVSLAAPESYQADWKYWKWATLPMLPETFKIEAGSKTKSQLSIIKKLFKEAERVIAATDADREGQYIFATIASYLALKKPVDRLWLSENTSGAILKGLAHMKPNSAYDNLANAAATRAQSDWLVGLNATRAFSLRHGKPGEPLSIGRVQTPTLRLVVDRDTSILDFDPKPYWELQVTFQSALGDYVGLWLDTQTEHPHHIVSAAEAERLASKVPVGTSGEVVSVDKKRVVMRSPLLYSLNALQKEANRRMGLTAQQTLDSAQRLYDTHLTSYPRTDAQHITTEIAQEIPQRMQGLTVGSRELRLQAISGLSQRKSRIVNDAKVNEAGHYAIIPTGEVPHQQLSPIDQAIYDLVCRRFLAALLPDGLDERTRVITGVNGELFATKGTAVVIRGWRDALEPVQEEDDTSRPEDDRDDAIPQGLTPKTPVVVKECSVDSKQTKPPARINDASLLGMMEKYGLGTPATRARIVEILLLRGYVEREKKALISTDKGRRLLTLVPDQIQSPALTGEWEAKLEAIALGTGDSGEFMEGIRQLTRSLVEVARAQSAESLVTEASALGPCPKCHLGSIISTRRGWGCTRYKEGCDFMIWATVAKKKVTESQARTLVNGRTTAVLKGFKGKSGKSFSARLALDDHFQVTFVFEKRPQAVSVRETKAKRPGGAR